MNALKQGFALFLTGCLAVPGIAWAQGTAGTAGTGSTGGSTATTAQSAGTAGSSATSPWMGLGSGRSVRTTQTGTYSSHGGSGSYASHGGSGGYASNRDASVSGAGRAATGLGSVRRGTDGVSSHFGAGGFGANEFGPGGFGGNGLGREGVSGEQFDPFQSGASGFERDGIRQSGVGRPGLGRGQDRTRVRGSLFPDTRSRFNNGLAAEADAAIDPAPNPDAAQRAALMQSGLLGGVNTGGTSVEDSNTGDARSTMFRDHGGMFNR